MRLMFVGLCCLAWLSTLAQSALDTVLWTTLETNSNTAYMAGKYEQAGRCLDSVAQLLPGFDRFPSRKLGNHYRCHSHVAAALGQIDRAIIYHRKSVATYRQILAPDNKIRIDVEYEMGYLYDHGHQIDSALHYYRLSLDAYQAAFGDSIDDIPLVLHQIAVIYRTLGLSQEALTYEKAAYHGWEKLNPFESHRMQSASWLMGKLYNDQEDYVQANRYYDDYMRIGEAINREKPEALRKLYLSLIHLYINSGQQEKVAEVVDKMMPLYQNRQAFPPANLAQIQYALGRFELEAGNYHQAVTYLSECITYYQSLDHNQVAHDLGTAHLLAARCLVKVKQLEEAQLHLNHLQDLYETHLPTQVNWAYIEQIDWAFAAADTVHGLAYAEKLWQFYLKDSSASSLSSDLLQALPEAPKADWRSTLKILINGAEYFWKTYQSTQSPIWLQRAYLAYQQLDTWYDPLNQAFTQFSPQMMRSRQLIYQGVLKTAAASYLLNPDATYLEQAFASAEYLQAFPLFMQLRRQEGLSYHDLSADLLQGLQTTQAELGFYHSKLSASSDSTKQSFYRNQISELLVHQDSLSDVLAEQSDRSAPWKQPTPILLKELQETIPDRRRIVRYSLVDSFLTTFVIAPKSVRLSCRVLSAAQMHNLAAYPELLMDYEAFFSSPQDTRTQIAELSHQIYEDLIGHLFSDSSEIPDELIIIPDGRLSQIPFESLCVVAVDNRKTNFAQWPYLLRYTDLSYAASAGLYVEQIKEHKYTKHPPKRLAAFAPAYDQVWMAAQSEPTRDHLSSLLRDGWYALDGAQEEVKRVVKHLDGDVFVGSEATKQAFLAHAGDYQILHFAMHSMIDPEFPLQSSLVFSTSGQDSSSRELYAADLFGIKLPADLVVLSACQTGFEGEDVQVSNYSLAKAFQYAGSKALITTKWKVSDQATAQLMDYFYANLAQGQDKAQALRQAKLDYLASVDAPEQAHPFFWAAFVLQGNREAISKDGDWPIGAMVLGGMLLLLAAVVFMRKKSHGF